jgi:hypothetical protein
MMAAMVLSTVVARADDLSKVDKVFATVAAVSMAVMFTCDIKPVQDGVRTLADKIGVSDTKFAAVRAAIQANAGLPYERDDLVPEITRVVISAMAETMSDIDDNKSRGCKKWTGALKTYGVFE